MSEMRPGAIPKMAVFAVATLVAGALALSPVAHAGMKEGLEAAEKGNFKKALAELLPLAREGNAEAAYGVGDLYRSGRGGVKQDLAQAARWYRVAAERSHVVAQYNLAVFYTVGQGVKTDMAEARHWYRMAAEKGFVPAQYNLGVIHAAGKGGPADLVRAYLWFELAAAQGHEEAARNRDRLAGEMTKAQLAAARELVRDWRERQEAKKKKG